MKIAVTNAVLSNTEDAAMLHAILTSLGESDRAEPADVVGFDVNAKVTSTLNAECRIAIAYAFKTLELFRSLSLDDFVITMEYAWLTRTLDTLAADPSRAVLSPERLRQLREQALRPARELVPMLGA